MPQVQDDWERLVNATLDREHLRELALAPSRETSIRSSASAYRLNYAGNFRFKSVLAHVPELSIEKEKLVKQIQLAERLMKVAGDATIFKQECTTIRNKAEILTNMLHMTAHASEELYSRPTYKVMNDAQGIIDKSLALVSKCRGGLKRVFNNISAASFDDITFQLEHCISNFSWLLRDEDHLYQAVPPIASNEPILYHVWELMAFSAHDDGEVYARLIIEEGGAQLLSKLIKPGLPLELQENAANLLGLMGKYGSGRYIDAKVRSTFATILESGPPSLKSTVLRAVSEMATHDIHEGHFEQHSIFYLFISHFRYSFTERAKNYTCNENSEERVERVKKLIKKTYQSLEALDKVLQTAENV